MSAIEGQSTATSEIAGRTSPTHWVTPTEPAAASIGSSSRKSSLSHGIKRTIDVASAAILSVLLLPVFAAIALVIKFASPGPVFFRDVRVGCDGKPFRMWKFRTMVKDAERILDECLNDPALRREWTRSFKLQSDPRVIPGVGQLLRRTNLDELPQLWNVLAGEMSLVGPRPLPLYHLDQFEDEFRRLRAAVRPGVTGPWQISNRNDGGPESYRVWDSFYVNNWSIWLDLNILFRTPWTIVFHQGRLESTEIQVP